MAKKNWCRGTVLKVLLLAILSTNSNAQTLNKIFSRATNIRAAICESESHYFISNTMNNNPRIVDFIKTDLSGSLIDSLRLQFPDSNFYFNTHNGLLAKDGMLFSVFSNAINTPADSSEIVFIRLNSSDLSLDTLQRFSMLGYSWTSPYACNWSADSNLLITGYVANNGFQAPYLMFLAKFDRNFNLMWQRVINGSPASAPFGPIGSDIEVSADGSILVTGNPYFIVPKQMAFAARFSQDGTKQWYRQYFSIFGSSGLYCVDNGDQTYQYVLNSWTSSSGGLNRLVVGEMDTLGNLTSRDTLGYNTRNQFAQDLIKLSDGSYYTAGYNFKNTFYTYGMKFNRSGDSIWYRGYRYDPTDTLDECYLQSFYQDNDSNIVHIGTYADLHNPGPGNGLYSWLFRTDRHGCFQTDCHLGIEVKSEPTWNTFPNPCSGKLEIIVPEACTIKLIDISGRLMWEQDYLQNGNYHLNLESLPKGIYQLIFETNRLYLTKKIVLN